MPLYHYTCAHHHKVIERDGLLKPAILVATRAQRDILRRDRATRLTSQLVWLTTIPHLVWLNGSAAGLHMDQSAALVARSRPDRTAPRPCDRTAFRWEIIETNAIIESWTTLRDYWPNDVVAELERVPGVKPRTWWVSRGPLRARYSPHQVEQSA